MRKKTKVGLEADGYMQAGELVPDDVVNRIVAETLDDLDYDSFVLDGYPRTVTQAEFLLALLKDNDAPVDAVISLRVSEDRIVQRLSRRRTHRETGEIYHLDFNPPPDHVSEDELIHRKDDRPEAIRIRLIEYHEKTQPLESYFREKGLLVEVDGLGSLGEVQARVEAVLS